MLILRNLLLFCLLGVLLTACQSQKTIVNGLDEREANEIIVFLANKGITATKAPSTEGTGAGGGTKVVLWDIKVDDTQSKDAMAYLNMAGLPRRRSQSLLNIFSGGGLVPSQMEEKIRYQAGLAEQIASTIRKIDGVLDAEVVLSFPEEDPLNPNQQNKEHVTASVYVKHNGVLDDPNSHLTTKIKRLVASSIPGLKIDDVTVIGDRARFTDVLPDRSTSSADNQFISIWTVGVAKSSVGRFQLIFFSFLFIVLASALAAVWVIWKVYPILKAAGGPRQLLKIAPLQLEALMGGTLEEGPAEQETADSKQPPEAAEAAEVKKESGTDET